MALWIADGRLGLHTKGRPVLPVPCYGLCTCGRQLFAAFDRHGCCICPYTADAMFDFSLPPGVCALTPFGPYVCALSRDADCLWVFSPKDGAPCLSIPAGSYPGDLCISPCGRFMAIAGSAAGEVIVLDQSLHCIRRQRVAGNAAGICFSSGRLHVLCAVGDENISSRLIGITPRGVTEECCCLPSPPCALCALPDGGLMMGCHGGVWLMNPQGQLRGKIPASLPVRIRAHRGGALIADSGTGTLMTHQGKVLWRGAEPMDMCIV